MCVCVRARARVCAYARERKHVFTNTRVQCMQIYTCSYPRVRTCTCVVFLSMSHLPACPCSCVLYLFVCTHISMWCLRAYDLACASIKETLSACSSAYECVLVINIYVYISLYICIYI